MIDLRMNILNNDVDYFVISESTKTHQGEDKKLNFNIENFKKYKHKIIYKIAEFDQQKDFILNFGLIFSNYCQTISIFITWTI